MSANFVPTDKVLLNLVSMQMPGNNQRSDVCGMMLCVCCVIVVLTDIIACVCGNPERENCSSVFVLLFFIRFTQFVVERVSRNLYK